jgi:hypothetical protein
MPVTHGVTGSSPVRTAKRKRYISNVYDIDVTLSCVYSLQLNHYRHLNRELKKIAGA